MDMPQETTRVRYPVHGTQIADDLTQGLMQQLRMARELADSYAVSDIETSAAPEQMAGATWYDVRPMLSTHEHAPQVVDMALLALQYAAARGLITHHPQHAHMVRINRRAG